MCSNDQVAEVHTLTERAVLWGGQCGRFGMPELFVDEDTPPANAGINASLTNMVNGC